MAIRVEFQLESIVQKPSWREVLTELIITEQIDPWNVDIVKVCEGFIKKVKEMDKVDLHIPANIVLASAILLKFKSEAIRFEEEQEAIVQGEEIIGEETIPELKLAGRIPPKRQITLQELLSEIENVLKFEQKKSVVQEKKIQEIINLEVSGFDIEKKMEMVYELIMSSMNGSEYVSFSKLIVNKENREIIETFLSILYLSQNKRINIEQKKWDGEINIAAVNQ